MAKKNKKIIFIVILIVLTLYLINNSGIVSRLGIEVSNTLQFEQIVGTVPASLPTATASNTLNLGPYRIVTEQPTTYTTYASEGCRTNTCVGTETAQDEFGCPLYTEGERRSERNCIGSSGYICGYFGCGIYTGHCVPNFAGCDQIIYPGNPYGQYPESVRCLSGNWQIDTCFNGEQQNFGTCVELGVTSCGGYWSSGPSTVSNKCGGKYSVYYNDVLVDNLDGASINSKFINTPTLTYYASGVSTESFSEADIGINLHATELASGGCQYTTNSFQFLIAADSFSGNIQPIINLDAGTAQLIGTINNAYTLPVYGNLKVIYNKESVIGFSSEKLTTLVELIPGSNTLLIDIPNDAAIERLDIFAQLDVLLSTTDFNGFNVPSSDCFSSTTGQGTLGDQLVGTNQCDYIRIGNSLETYEYDIIDELRTNLESSQLQSAELETQLSTSQTELEQLRIDIINLEQNGISYSDSINELQLTLTEKAELIESLNLTIKDKSELVDGLNLTLLKKSGLIKSMQLQIDEEADLVSRLPLENEQLILLITSLRSTQADQINLIARLNLNLDQKEAIIKEISRSETEKDALILQLKQTMDGLSQQGSSNQTILMLVLGIMVYFLAVRRR